MIKICPRCKISKILDDFSKNKLTKDGLQSACKECKKKEPKNLEYHRNYTINYYKNNKDLHKNRCKISKEKKPEYYKILNKKSKVKYRKNNLEYFRKYDNERYTNNPEIKLKKCINARIRQSLNRIDKTKEFKSIKYLGCNIKDYQDYLNNKFTSEMSWSNYGSYWEIDHIKAIDNFDLSLEEEQYKCFHYTNTQPLTIFENRSKSNKE